MGEHEDEKPNKKTLIKTGSDLINGSYKFGRWLTQATFFAPTKYKRITEEDPSRSRLEVFECALYQSLFLDAAYLLSINKDGELISPYNYIPLATHLASGLYEIFRTHNKKLKSITL